MKRMLLGAVAFSLLAMPAFAQTDAQAAQDEAAKRAAELAKQRQEQAARLQEEAIAKLPEVEQAMEAAIAAAAEKPGDVALVEAAVNACQEFGTTAARANEREKYYSSFGRVIKLVEPVIGDNMANANLLQPYVTARLSSFNLTPGTGEEKLAAVAELESFIQKLDADDESLKVVIESVNRSVASLSERFAEEMRREKELIGTPAPALPAEAWINGEAMTAEQLEGKVVFIDFWAVWCGPCIATFPHLREWNEKYADKGLVMIGVTDYYSYGWDGEQSRPVRVNGITQEDEQSAMLEFAANYDLHHRFAIVPNGSDYRTHFQFRGIPTAAIIDRDGTIRMIKTGNTPGNAKDFDNMLRTLFNDTASGDE